MLKKSTTYKLNLKCLVNVLSQTYEAALDILPPHGDPVYEKVKHSLFVPQSLADSNVLDATRTDGLLNRPWSRVLERHYAWPQRRPDRRCGLFQM